MQMLSKKDPNSAELETVQVSKNSVTVITANGEVQTHEEATMYVKVLDLFLTVKLLEDTLAVLLLGKLCEEHGDSYEWTSGHLPHLVKNGRKIRCNTENHVPIFVPGLPTGSSSSTIRTSTTSFPQDSEASTFRPAITRSQNTSSKTLRDPLRVRAVFSLLFPLLCVRSRVLLQSFLSILGPDGFPMREQP